MRPQDVHQTADSYAAYAQATFHFTDQPFMTVGGASKDKKEGCITRPPTCSGDLPRRGTADSRRIDDSKFTYWLGLN